VVDSYPGPADGFTRCPPRVYRVEHPEGLPAYVKKKHPEGVPEPRALKEKDLRKYMLELWRDAHLQRGHEVSSPSPAPYPTWGGPHATWGGVRVEGSKTAAASTCWGCGKTHTLMRP